jgi:peptidoglycan hydrolase CwlO-like protein
MSDEYGNLDLDAIWPKLDAHDALLQAARDTQQYHTAVLRDHTQRLTRVETTADGLEAKIDGIDVKVNRLTAELGEVQSDVAGLKSDVTELKGDVRKILDLLTSGQCRLPY